MNNLATAALVALVLSAAACKDPGDAFVDDVCACKDKDCLDKALKAHETKFPESKAKLGEMEKMDAKKKEQLGKAMECMMKLAGEKK